MADLHRGERLQIMLSSEEVLALDNWRFEKRMPSRAAAIRELLRRGLASEGFMAADGHKKSTEYGVVDASDQNGGTSPRLNGDGSHGRSHNPSD